MTIRCCSVQFHPVLHASSRCSHPLLHPAAHAGLSLWSSSPTATLGPQLKKKEGQEANAHSARSPPPPKKSMVLPSTNSTVACSSFIAVTEQRSHFFSHFYLEAFGPPIRTASQGFFLTKTSVKEANMLLSC